MKGNSFVMYRSFYNNFLKVKKDFGNEKALAYIEAILNFGFTGETPDEDSILWAFGLETMFNNIDASISRYERAEANGGGRPGVAIKAEQIYEQMALYNTWKEVAHALGIDEDTLRKLRNNYNITERSPRNYRKTEKPNIGLSENRKTDEKDRKAEIPKNLNYNVNQNFNFNNNNNLVSYAQNENSDKNHEEKKPNGIRFFPDDEVKTEKFEKSHGQKTESFSVFSDTIIKTEKTEKGHGQNSNHELSPQSNNSKVQVLLSQPILSRDEADFLLTHSDLPLFIEDGKMYMEDTEKEWIIV